MNFRVSQIDLRHGQCGFFGMKIGNELSILRLKHGLCASFCFHRDLAASQCGFCLFEICLAACCLRRESLLIRDRSLNALLCRSLTGQQSLLARPLCARSDDIRLHRIYARGRRRNLRLGLVYSGERPLNS
jgi:hypothetical protein